MKHKITSLIVITVLAAQLAAAQTPITFDLTNLTNGVHSSSVTASDGTTVITVTSQNKDGSARSIYVGPNGLETFFSAGTANSITFNFNTEVTLESYFIGSASITFEGDERFTFRLNSQDYQETFPVDNRNMNNTTRTFNNKLTIPANTDFEIISFNPDNGVESMYWETLTVTVVPEPETYALIFAGAALITVALRRRLRP